MNRSREHAQVLMEKAHGDAWVLNRVIADPDAPSWSLGFHAQQAAEKAIKAVLSKHSIEYPRTHNLSLLLDLLHKNRLPSPPDADRLPRLTPFGAPLRYDDEYEADERKVDLDRSWLKICVRQTLEWAESVLNQ